MQVFTRINRDTHREYTQVGIYACIYIAVYIYTRERMMWVSKKLLCYIQKTKKRWEKEN